MYRQVAEKIENAFGKQELQSEQRIQRVRSIGGRHFLNLLAVKNRLRYSTPFGKTMMQSLIPPYRRCQSVVTAALVAAAGRVGIEPAAGLSRTAD